MKQAQNNQKIEQYQTTILDNLKKFHVKFTLTNYAPKNKSNPKNTTKQSNLQSLHKLRQLKNTSAQNQSVNQQKSLQVSNTSYELQTCQEDNRKSLSYHSSYTKKIIDDQIPAKQSNLIGRMARNKMCSRLYDEIQQINSKQQRLGQKTVQYQSERTSQKSKKINFKMYQQQVEQQPLYKSLPQPFIKKKILATFDTAGVSSNYFRTKNSLSPHKKYSQALTNQLKHLQINVGRQKRDNQCIDNMLEQITKINTNLTSIMQTSINKKNKYKKKKLQPLKIANIKQKMSNNIKDYLSVQKIRIKQIQEHLVAENTTSPIKQRLTFRQDDFDLSIGKRKLSGANKQKKLYNTVGGSIPVNPQYIPRATKFNPPFQLYYYRDFIWKIGFSNQQVIQTPMDYETKVKVFIGKGNNSNLIRGFIKRRPWYQITQKYQEANFVWTQIKIQAMFTLQKKSDKQIEYRKVSTQLQENIKNQTSLSTLNELEKIKFTTYWAKNLTKQMKFKQNLKNRSKIIGIKQLPVSTSINNIKIHNHFRNNYVIGNKKALFSLMNHYYASINEEVFKYLPLTFHIKNGLQDEQYLKFLQHFYSISKQIKRLEQSQLKSYIYKHNAWIVKPGENTNRGNGIIVCLNLNQVKAILKRKQKHNDGTYKTYILQKYIQKPLLYKKRKFDLRHYIMISSTNGIMKGYWYKEGYVRTTSAQYTLKFSSGGVHLTNDAVQKNLPDYGKYQKGNKISYQELNEFIKKNDSSADFFTMILPKMKKIATDLIKASAKLMDPQKRQNNFEVFGLDFMIDQAYNVWIIECNSNPCLQLSCPLLGRVIPKMVQNAFRICLDPIFVPPTNFAPKSQQYYLNINQENKFELVYDQRLDKSSEVDDKKKGGVSILENTDFQQDDDTFDDDGQQLED